MLLNRFSLYRHLNQHYVQLVFLCVSSKENEFQPCDGIHKRTNVISTPTRHDIKPCSQKQTDTTRNFTIYILQREGVRDILIYLMDIDFDTPHKYGAFTPFPRVNKAHNYGYIRV